MSVLEELHVGPELNLLKTSSTRGCIFLEKRKIFEVTSLDILPDRTKSDAVTSSFLEISVFKKHGYRKPAF